MSTQTKRYVDVHKHYVMVGAVDQPQQTVLPPRKVALVELEDGAQKYLRSTDEVVLEATTNAWYVPDLLEPLVGPVVVTHPPHIKLIAAAMVKTDKKDTMTLAKLLAVNLVPEVWVPPQTRPRPESPHRPSPPTDQPADPIQKSTAKRPASQPYHPACQ